MRNAVRSVVALALISVSAVGCASNAQNVGNAPQSADIILTNARIYTVEDGQPWAKAIAIRDGKILAVGNEIDVGRLSDSNTQVIDLAGRLIMPSFGDAHNHPVFGGMAYSRCSLHKGKSIAEYQAIIAGCVVASTGDSPIYGVGWNDGLFPPKGVPRKELLDAVSTQRALIFESVGGHSYWVNSRALELAGITKATPDPANGNIDRDDKTGEPVGGLQESAMALVGGLVPTPTSADMQNSIIYVAKQFNALGITSWHDAGIDLAADGSSQTLNAYKAVNDAGALTAHVSLAFKWDNARALEQISSILLASKKASDWGLDAKSVKFYVDGVIPQQTAAMIEPYEHAGDHRGPLQIAPDILEKAVVQLGASGFQPHVHAIGDRATRIALDAFAASLKQNGDARRPMISHLNVIDPVDQPRFGKIGVIANLQPTWASNYAYMDLAKTAIGPLRSESIYPAASVLRAGGMIAYGADWPVATANPLLGLQVAITRVNYEEPTSPSLLPTEVLTLVQAVRAHTINVAYANGFEKFTGSIAPGKSADLIVLDRNIFEIPVMDIGKTNVLLTLFKGRQVHGDLGQFREAVVK
jgi:predicted amidohydrolase YtcJ